MVQRLTNMKCDILSEVFETTRTVVFFLISLIYMIFSMFFVIGNLVIKLILWLASEEAEIDHIFYGEETYGQASSNMRKHFIDFFFV